MAIRSKPGTSSSEPGTSNSAAPRRMLVVDDNHDIADSTSVLLSMLGHSVETAYDGPSALELVQRCRADTILLDIAMPGMSGYDVARQIRGLGLRYRVNLIAVSGHGEPADLERGLDAGFDFHLVKPLDWAVLDKVMGELPAAHA